MDRLPTFNFILLRVLKCRERMLALVQTLYQGAFLYRMSVNDSLKYSKRFSTSGVNIVQLHLKMHRAVLPSESRSCNLDVML